MRLLRSLCSLAMTAILEFPSTEILGSSPRMTAKRKSGDDTEHARWIIFIEIASVALLPRNDGDFRIP